MNLPVSALLKPYPTLWDLPSEDPLEPGYAYQNVRFLRFW
jgi:hypothetical protein